MAIPLNDNLFVHAPKLLDAREGEWPDIATCIANVPRYIRTRGLTVKIQEGDGVVEYWWRTGIENEDLEQKIPDVALSLNPKDAVETTSGTGENITLSGIQNIQGVDGAEDLRVLLRSQSNPEENGIYLMKTGAWERASDAVDWSDFVNSYVPVADGNYRGYSYYCTVPTNGDVGVDPITYVVFNIPGDLDIENVGEGVNVYQGAEGNVHQFRSLVVDDTPELTITEFGEEVVFNIDLSDYVVPDHVKNITQTNINNWNLAYGMRHERLHSVTSSSDHTMSGNAIVGRIGASVGAPMALSASATRSFLNIEDGANNYSHPTGFSNTPAEALVGAFVISRILVNSQGHTEGVETREVTTDDIGAAEEIHNHNHDNLEGLTPDNHHNRLHQITGHLDHEMVGERIVGRILSASGQPQELTASEVRSFLNVSDGADSYNHWNLDIGGEVTNVTSGYTLEFEGTGDLAVSLEGNRVIFYTEDSGDTTYTAGDGLDLSQANEFSVDLDGNSLSVGLDGLKVTDDLFVPYNGATQEVNLGDEDLSTTGVINAGNIGVGTTAHKGVDVLAPANDDPGIRIRRHASLVNSIAAIYFKVSENDESVNTFSSFIGGRRTVSGQEIVFGTADTQSGTPSVKVRIDGDGNLRLENNFVLAESVFIGQNFVMEEGAQAGYVMTSNANGFGTWQPPSGTGGSSTFIGLSDTPGTIEDGKMLIGSGSELIWADVTSGGTVTSVDLSVPDNIFEVTSDPVTTSGELRFDLKEQEAKKVFAGPLTGEDDKPIFRRIVPPDVEMTMNRIMGNNQAAIGTGNAMSLTATQVRTMLNVASGADNYNHWKIHRTGQDDLQIGSGNVVRFVAGTYIDSITAAWNALTARYEITVNAEEQADQYSHWRLVSPGGGSFNIISERRVRFSPGTGIDSIPINWYQVDGEWALDVVINATEQTLSVDINTLSPGGNIDMSEPAAYRVSFPSSGANNLKVINMPSSKLNTSIVEITTTSSTGRTIVFQDSGNNTLPTSCWQDQAPLTYILPSRRYVVYINNFGSNASDLSINWSVH